MNDKSLAEQSLNYSEKVLTHFSLYYFGIVWFVKEYRYWIFVYFCKDDYPLLVCINIVMLQYGHFVSS